MKKEVSSAIKADVAMVLFILPTLFIDNLQSAMWVAGVALILPWFDLLLDKYFVWWVSQYCILTVLTFIPKGGHVLIIYWIILTVLLILVGISCCYKVKK
jgi:hypothetical protein